MKKYIILLLLFCSPFGSLFATHIVGGEFEMTYKGGNIYRITLNLYFDAVNGEIGALDQQVVVDIFQKSDNLNMETIIMPKRSEEFVQYSNPDCAVGQLSTKKILYWLDVELYGNVYTDPLGYYLVWQRCCRNNIISNILNPESTGQTFYLEFPPVTQNGNPFVNNSPVLFPPLSDYACINELFYFDFSGSDTDGDSLAYSLVKPLRGSSDPAAIPVNMPAPYPTVSWAPGFSTTEQINGPEPLNIDPVTGILRVTANQLGLFVFSVKCDEFRNGIKIGEVRRDFQLMVLNCPSNAKPEILAQHAVNPGVNYQPGQVLSIEEGSSRCFKFIMTDPDPNEFLAVSFHPVNFNFPGFNGSSSGIINNIPGNDALEYNFCFPRCLPTRTTPYLLDVIVKDDGCSVPKQDTIRIAFNYTPPANLEPNIASDLPGNVVNATVGDPISFNVTGIDPDQGLVTISAFGEGFNLSSLGISFPQVSGPSPLTAHFNWVATCLAFTQSPFTVNFVVQDTMCTGGLSDTISVLFNITGLPNQLPAAISPVAATTAEVGNLLSFGITATDPDTNDPLELILVGDGFDYAALGMQFSTINNTTPVQGTFSWTPGCSAIAPGDYTLFFIARDFPCNATEPDTHRVTITVNYLNQPPSILAPPVHQSEIGQEITIPITAHDPNLDFITVTADGSGINLEDYGITFSPFSGTGSANGQLTWTPNCLTASLPEDIRIWLVVTEDACQPNETDRTELILHTIYTNDAPILTLQQPNSQAPQPNEIEIEIGQQLVFDIFGNDINNDLLALAATGDGFDLNSAGIQFNPDTQNGQVQSTFSWIPDCETSGPGTYTVRFALNETTCQPRDTAAIVTIRVIEPRATEEFIPANIFTPNGDGINDVFEFPTLPPDICSDKFVQMQLFNRWGKRIYSSPSRNFSWDGGDAPAGVYFYQLEFEKKQYKGWVTLVR